MQIKKGDTVYILSGKDKGKSAKVLRAFPQDMKILVEGVNVVKKHQRAGVKGSKKGSIIEKSLPIHAAKASLIDPKTGKPTRVRFEMNGDKKVRVAVKSGTTIK